MTATVNGVTTTYVGGVYERQGNSTRKHYYFGGAWVYPEYATLANLTQAQMDYIAKVLGAWR